MVYKISRKSLKKKEFKHHTKEKSKQKDPFPSEELIVQLFMSCFTNKEKKD